ncbi:MAG: hypothetical protein ACJ73S_05375 [Mycobacteriales bacterium]
MTVPDPAVVLVAQVAEVRADLARVERVLGDATVADPGQRAVRDRFQVLAHRVATDLARIDAQARLPGAAPGLWPRLAASRGEVARISREALAFLQGVLLRASGLDDGVGAVADRMLAGLTARTGVDRSVLTAVDDREFLDHTVSMVRLRFPDTSVWGLPIVAHELGHHVAIALVDADPALRAAGAPPVLSYLIGATTAEVAAGADRTQAKAWLHELFADVYATYALGAAYPLAVLTLRAAPDQYADATPTHPSWRRRVTTMVGALEAMGSAAPDPARARAYRLLVERRVVPVWRLMSGDGIPAGPAAGTARRQAAEMVDLLARHAPDRLRYDPTAPVERLVALLDAAAADPYRRRGQPPDLPAGTAVPHVLNAAWRWRVEHWNADRAAIDRVSGAALDCCLVAEA